MKGVLFGEDDVTSFSVLMNWRPSPFQMLEVDGAGVPSLHSGCSDALPPQAAGTGSSQAPCGEQFTHGFWVQ